VHAKPILCPSNNLDHQYGVTAREWLKTTTCSSLFPEQRTEIVTVEKEDDVKDAYKLLIDHKILSAPVWDPKHSLYTAFFDVLDVVNFTIKQVPSQSLGSLSEFEKLINSESFYKEKVKRIAGSSGRNQYFAFQSNTPLAIALDAMGSNKLHRFAVVESDGNLVTIVTASHVCQLLYKHSTKFPVSSRRVGDIELGLKSTMSVKTSDKAYQAFRLICDNQVSGVAVVDDNGRLIGNISGSDLRQVGYDGKLMTKLLLNVSDFLNLLPKHEDMPGPYCVRTTATLYDVLSMITETHTHRVYVVDDAKKPIGVISLIDIIYTMVKSVA